MCTLVMISHVWNPEAYYSLCFECLCHCRTFKAKGFYDHGKFRQGIIIFFSFIFDCFPEIKGHHS